LDERAGRIGEFTLVAIRGVNGDQRGERRSEG
jgi:hypothetical protein